MQVQPLTGQNIKYPKTVCTLRLGLIYAHSPLSFTYIQVNSITLVNFIAKIVYQFRSIIEK